MGYPSRSMLTQWRRWGRQGRQVAFIARQLPLPLFNQEPVVHALPLPSSVGVLSFDHLRARELGREYPTSAGGYKSGSVVTPGLCAMGGTSDILSQSIIPRGSPWLDQA